MQVINITYKFKFMETTEKAMLKKRLRDIKHSMFITRPLRGYLGSQYYYWESKYNEIKKQINNLTK